MKNNKYLILRRVVQALILLLFVSSSYWGMKILMGNYSSALVMEMFYLADPYTMLQVLFTGFIPSMELIVGAVIISLFYAVLGGRLFCSWVCPLNVVTDFSSYLRKRFKIKTLINKKRFRKVPKGKILCISSWPYFNDDFWSSSFRIY